MADRHPSALAERERISARILEMYERRLSATEEALLGVAVSVVEARRRADDQEDHPEAMLLLYMTVEEFAAISELVKENE